MNKQQRQWMWMVFLIIFLVNFIGGSIFNEFGGIVLTYISIPYFLIALTISTYYAVKDKNKAE
jgi:hypothetical protein